MVLLTLRFIYMAPLRPERFVSSALHNVVLQPPAGITPPTLEESEPSPFRLVLFALLIQSQCKQQCLAEVPCRGRGGTSRKVPEVARLEPGTRIESHALTTDPHGLSSRPLQIFGSIFLISGQNLWVI